MTYQYPELFYFIKDSQKSTTLRRTISNGKTYYYMSLVCSAHKTSRFNRVSEYEYNVANNWHNTTKDCFVTYIKNGKTYHEHDLRFKGFKVC